MVAAGPEGADYGCRPGHAAGYHAAAARPGRTSAADFNIFTGTSGSVYTDWPARAILVTVSEAKDTPDAGRWSARRATYERMQELVDPRAVERPFTGQATADVHALAFASYLIYSNHRRRPANPGGDRSVPALSNGVRMPPEMAKALQAWMDQPGNIANWRGGWRRDNSKFDAFQAVE